MPQQGVRVPQVLIWEVTGRKFKKSKLLIALSHRWSFLCLHTAHLSGEAKDCGSCSLSPTAGCLALCCSAAAPSLFWASLLLWFTETSRWTTVQLLDAEPTPLTWRTSVSNTCLMTYSFLDCTYKTVFSVWCSAERGHAPDPVHDPALLPVDSVEDHFLMDTYDEVCDAYFGF